MFKILQSIHLTEKVTDLKTQSNQYAFKVDKNATKSQVKRAVEEYFSVKVDEVRTIKVKGKVKRSRYRLQKKPDWKKAYVKLAEGNSIDIGAE